MDYLVLLNFYDEGWAPDPNPYPHMGREDGFMYLPLKEKQAMPSKNTGLSSIPIAGERKENIRILEPVLADQSSFFSRLTHQLYGKKTDKLISSPAQHI